MAAELYIGKVCAKHPELGGKRYKLKKTCQGCEKAASKAWAKANPEKVNAYSRAQYAKNPEREKARTAARHKANPEKANAYSRKAKRKSAYGITEAQYQALIVSQNNCCLICKMPAGARTLHIDHCHVSGKIRGLLCGKCNKALGLLGDNVEVLKAAIKYLRKHSK